MGNYKVINYTREAMEEDIYSAKLADSVHLALVNGEEITTLNHNSGFLFAKADWQKDKTMIAKSLKNPWLFKLADGRFGVVAVRINTDGTDDESSKGCILYYESEDLLSYTTDRLVKISDSYVNDVKCEYDASKSVYVITWTDNMGKCFAGEIGSLSEASEYVEAVGVSGTFDINAQAAVSAVKECDVVDSFVEELAFAYKEVNLNAKEEKKSAADNSPEPEELEPNIVIMPIIEGAKYRNMIEISDELAKRLICKVTVPINTSIDVPETITVSSREELDALRYDAHYSDGTTSVKRVDWFAEDIDFSKSGEYELEGRVHQDHYEFPIAFNRADPCIGKWNGKYYFIATNDADWNHTLYIREGDSIPSLVTAQESLILDSDTYDHIGNLLWAPEFHIIKNRLYIFHAATPAEFGDEQSHVTALKPGGNPSKKSDWEMPRKVLKKDGTPLFTTGITLDMTVIPVNGRYFVSWSQREFVPKDLGAWLYIAEIDADEPWKLISDPVVLSAPEFGWANNHTFVDEGPYALIKDGKIFLTFSSALVDATYVVGLLTADIDADLLDINSWTKTNYPLLTSRSVEGQYGTGHNAYIQDEDGIYWNTYHGRPGVTAPRSSGIRRVHFDIDGYPMLDLTEDKDLAPELAWVKTKLIVK